MNINGFEIEKYNQYGYPEKAKTGICPFCSADRKKSTDKCVSLFWDTGLGHCNHCGEHFQLHTYAKKTDQKKTYIRPEKKNITELPQKTVDWFKNIRGISQGTLKLMRIGYGEEWMPGPESVVPVMMFNYFVDNELVNIKYRDGGKNFKLFKDAEKVFYNLDNIKLSDTCIIVEGEIDALSYIEAGIFNVVSTPNGSPKPVLTPDGQIDLTKSNVNLDYLDNYLEYFDNKEIIYLALDNDAPGQNVQREFIRRLGFDKCRLVDFKDCKDANEYLVKYGTDALKQTLIDATEVPLVGVSGIKDFAEDFELYVRDGMPKGYVTGLKSLDRVFSTFTKQFIVVTGIPTSGKSEFVDEMIVGYAQQYDWKIGIASKENKPNEFHAGKLMAKLCGHWINKAEYIGKDWYNKAIDYTHDHFKFVDVANGYSLESVLELGDQMVKRYGIKCLVIDPMNKTPLSDRRQRTIGEYTVEYLQKIDEWCSKNDCVIILVIHPTKRGSENGKVLRPVSLYDASGSHDVYDMTYNSLLVHRDFDTDTVEIEVFKVKFNHMGENGAKFRLRWSSRSGRYMELEHSVGDDHGPGIPRNNNYFTGTDTSISDIDSVAGYKLPPLPPNREFEEENLTVSDELPF